MRWPSSRARSVREDRAAAIGTWAGVSGVAAAVGPLLGGWLVDQASWRWIFAINLPLCLAAVALVRKAPESRDAAATGRFDVPGAVLTVLALGAATFALTASTEASPAVVAAAWVIAVSAAVAWVVVERRTASPLVPPSLFGSRVFSAANAMTVLVYGALGGVSLFTVLQLQAAGWGALQAGLSSLPITLALLLFSSRAAALSSRIGPRIPMTVGPLVCSAGALLLLLVVEGATWARVLPGMVVFSLGLALLVSPLTAAVLAAAPGRYAGAASGVNNAVARAGSLSGGGGPARARGAQRRRLPRPRVDDGGLSRRDAVVRRAARPRRGRQLVRPGARRTSLTKSATVSCQRLA